MSHSMVQQGTMSYRASNAQCGILPYNTRHVTYRRAVYKVVDVMEGHGEGGERQHHALLHIAFLETVASLAHAIAPTPQLVCTHTGHIRQTLNDYTPNMLFFIFLSNDFERFWLMTSK